MNWTEHGWQFKIKFWYYRGGTMGSLDGVPTCIDSQVGHQQDVILALSENVAATGELFRNSYMSVQEHSIAVM
jgi:hypothetical protein